MTSGRVGLSASTGSAGLFAEGAAGADEAGPAGSERAAASALTEASPAPSPLVGNAGGSVHTEQLAPAPDPHPSSVAGKVRSGLAWSLLNNATLRLGQLVSGIVLARILTPQDYGVYAIALTVLTLLQSANELGVSLALVQRPGDVREIASTVMTIAVGSSVGLYAITYALTPTLCQVMHSPQAVGVVRLMSVAVILDGIATVPIGLLNRYFQQRRLFVGEAVSFVSMTAVAIALAVSGQGPYSFAWGAIAGGVLGTATHWRLAPLRVWPGWNGGVVRPLLGFGLPLAGASLLMLSVANVDNLVVGAVLGQTVLGYYLLAFRQASWPVTLFSEAGRRVALAGFSRLADDGQLLSRAFGRGLALLMGATVPACVLLATYAEPLIRVIYGARWAPAAAALPLLAFFGLVRVGIFVGYDMLVALGRSRHLLWLQLVWLVGLVPALLVGSRIDGVRGAAAAQLLVAGVVVTPLFLLALKRLRVAPGRALRQCARPVVGGVALALVSWPVTVWFPGDLERLALAAASVLVVYLPIVWPMRSLLPDRSAGSQG